MNFSRGTDRSLTALSQTAKWELDDARAEYACAVKAREAAEQALNDTKVRFDEVSQQIRDSLGSDAINITILQQARFVQSHVHAKLVECEELLRTHSKRENESHRLLLDAKTRHEAYERLVERRRLLHQRDVARRQQVVVDDLGVGRLIRSSRV